MQHDYLFVKYVSICIKLWQLKLCFIFQASASCTFTWTSCSNAMDPEIFVAQSSLLCLISKIQRGVNWEMGGKKKEKEKKI